VKAIAKGFAVAITEAHEKIHRCSICCNLTDRDIALFVTNSSRDKSIICVVEDSRDVYAIEKTHEI
jgi:recombination protein RecR